MVLFVVSLLLTGQPTTAFAQDASTDALADQMVAGLKVYKDCEDTEWMEHPWFALIDKDIERYREAPEYDNQKAFDKYMKDMMDLKSFDLQIQRYVII